MTIMKKTFHVPDMHCSACMMKLEGLEDDLPGVKRVETSYQKQSMLVEFDDSKIGIEDIQKAVEKLGYTVKI